jgi:hypothetical protein
MDSRCKYLHPTNIRPRPITWRVVTLYVGGGLKKHIALLDHHPHRTPRELSATTPAPVRLPTQREFNTNHDASTKPTSGSLKEHISLLDHHPRRRVRFVTTPSPVPLPTQREVKTNHVASTKPVGDGLKKHIALLDHHPHGGSHNSTTSTSPYTSEGSSSSSTRARRHRQTITHDAHQLSRPNKRRYRAHYPNDDITYSKVDLKRPTYKPSRNSTVFIYF